MPFRAYMLKSFFYSLEKHFMHKIRKSVLLAFSLLLERGKR